MKAASAVARIAMLLSLVFLQAGCAEREAMVDRAAEVDAVRQRYVDWVSAEKRRDLEASVGFLAPEAVIHGEGAPAMQGVEAARTVWRAFFEIPYTDLVDVEPRRVVVAQSGDLAYDVGSWKLVVPGESGPTEERGKSTIVWQKQDGVWMAVVIAFSMDTPPTP